MVPTTTPNPDDTPPEAGTVERQLYPEPADHPPLVSIAKLRIYNVIELTIIRIALTEFALHAKTPALADKTMQLLDRIESEMQR